MIQERKESQLNDHYDLFSRLLAANDESKDEVKLSDSELIGKPPFNVS
jgi:cytochrome P450